MLRSIQETNTVQRIEIKTTLSLISKMQLCINVNEVIFYLFSF